ncbi:MAG: hypothetical protein PHO63_01470 [Bacilli bacterium]|nr:hypothetical protein [Bacilli bacterium]
MVNTSKIGNDDIFNYYYQMISKEGNQVYIDAILNRHPNYDISSFHKELFDNVFIEAYGLDFIIDNIDYLHYFTLEEAINTKQVEKLKYVCSQPNLKLLSSTFVLNPHINIDLLKKINSIVNSDNADIISSTRNLNQKKVDSLNRFIEDKQQQAILDFFIKKFEKYEITNNLDLIIDHIDNPHLNKLIQVINDNYFHDTSRVEDFIELFNSQLILLDKLEINPETIQMFNLNRPEYQIKTNQDLLNLLDIRDNYHQSLIDKSDNLTELKKTIINNYFNLDELEFNYKTNKYRQVNLISNELLLIEKINQIETKKDLKRYCLSIKNQSNFFIETDRDYNQICADDLVKSLTQVPHIIKSQNMIKLDGQAFKILVHKIKGYGNYKLALQLYDDISKWIQPSYPSSYISTSLISDKFMGTVEASGTTLGFNNIEASDIYDMGPLDIYTSSKKLEKCKLWNLLWNNW